VTLRILRTVVPSRNQAENITNKSILRKTVRVRNERLNQLHDLGMNYIILQVITSISDCLQNQGTIVRFREQFLDCVALSRNGL